MKKYQYLMLLAVALILSGCTATNPPDAPAAKGEWQPLNTSVSQIMKGY
ncbi:hypothetical protein L6706_004681 [Salmonella enterica]|nr:hypothetical protein [Salmonella enterica subsp. enterica serovar Java]EIU9113117.1 hypothetical protein [Salmonella enterica]EJC3483650.1 hypothetical protein [Salmonella enterica]EKZ3297878.1 hypothetical protein [Salmonella enterica]